MIDWEGGAAAFLYDLARRHEADPPAARELRNRWESLQFACLSGDWHPYRRVLADSLAELAGEYGWRWNKQDGERLARSMESWQPFPDTVPAPARRPGGRDRTLDHLQLRPGDHRAQPSSHGRRLRGRDGGGGLPAYKPSTTPFEHALREIGLRPDQILHVAFGFKYDIAPAQQLGLRTAWVNRHREPPPGDARPDHEWSDLWPLAEVG